MHCWYLHEILIWIIEVLLVLTMFQLYTLYWWHNFLFNNAPNIEAIIGNRINLICWGHSKINMISWKSNNKVICYVQNENAINIYHWYGYWLLSLCPCGHLIKFTLDLSFFWSKNWILFLIRAGTEFWSPTCILFFVSDLEVLTVELSVAYVYWIDSDNFIPKGGYFILIRSIRASSCMLI